eukprot:TRINITY_DN66283_c4_g1_i1.p1 TRINITY_DN66283_c4_g1~~TRINITY_DN66283_c4_g1_i1.p1  ORF type:complete len:655 (+),score=33.05 TRINITY_DN66283_c4_g1_i1:101-1966(+)
MAAPDVGLLQLFGQLTNSGVDRRQRSDMLMSMVLSRLIEEHVMREVLARSMEEQNQNTPSKPAATEEDIANLKRVSATASTQKKSTVVEQTEGQCPICFEENDDGREIIELPCTHSFCGGCITEWLRYTRTCPLCRTEMVGVTEEGTLDPQQQEELAREEREREQQRQQEEEERNAAANERDSQAVNSFQSIGEALGGLLETMQSLRTLQAHIQAQGGTVPTTGTFGGAPVLMMREGRPVNFLRDPSRMAPDRRNHGYSLEDGEDDSSDSDGEVRIISPRAMNFGGGGRLSGLGGLRTLSALRNSQSQTDGPPSSPPQNIGGLHRSILEGSSSRSSFSSTSTDDIELTPVMFGSGGSARNHSSSMSTSPRSRDRVISYFGRSPASSNMNGNSSSSNPNNSNSNLTSNPQPSTTTTTTTTSSNSNSSSALSNNRITSLPELRGGRGHSGRTLDTILMRSASGSVPSAGSSSNPVTTSTSTSSNTTGPTPSGASPTHINRRRSNGESIRSVDTTRRSGRPTHGGVTVLSGENLARSVPRNLRHSHANPSSSSSNSLSHSHPSHPQTTGGGNSTGINTGPPSTGSPGVGRVGSPVSAGVGAVPPPPPPRRVANGERFPRAILGR